MKVRYHNDSVSVILFGVVWLVLSLYVLFIVGWLIQGYLCIVVGVFFVLYGLLSYLKQSMKRQRFVKSGLRYSGVVKDVISFRAHKRVGRLSYHLVVDFTDHSGYARQIQSKLLHTYLDVIGCPCTVYGKNGEYIVDTIDISGDCD